MFFEAGVIIVLTLNASEPLIEGRGLRQSLLQSGLEEQRDLEIAFNKVKQNPESLPFFLASKNAWSKSELKNIFVLVFDWLWHEISLPEKNRISLLQRRFRDLADFSLLHFGIRSKEFQSLLKSDSSLVRHESIRSMATQSWIVFVPLQNLLRSSKDAAIAAETIGRMIPVCHPLLVEASVRKERAIRYSLLVGLLQSFKTRDQDDLRSIVDIVDRLSKDSDDEISGQAQKLRKDIHDRLRRFELEQMVRDRIPH